MIRAFDVEHFFKSYPDFVGENYSPRQMWEYKNNTKSWLNTLPIAEYAFVLMHFTAHHLGGEPTQYVNILYNKMLNPVIACYLRHLTFYRFMRSVEMRKYFSCMKIAPAEGHVTLKTKFGLCTARVKCILRKICSDYKYLKDLREDDPRVKQIIKIIKTLMTEFDDQLDKWPDVYERMITDARIREEDPPDTPSEPND